MVKNVEYFKPQLSIHRNKIVAAIKIEARMGTSTSAEVEGTKLPEENVNLC